MVVVSSDGTDGRERTQLLEHLRRSDVARMDDQIDAGERLLGLGAKQAVGVGDEPDDAHRKTQWPYLTTSCALPSAEASAYAAMMVAVASGGTLSLATGSA